MLASASEYYRRQQRISALGVRAARRARRNPGRLVAAVVGVQRLAVREAAAGVPVMLAEQRTPVAPRGSVNPEALVGLSSYGVPLGPVLAQAESDAALDLLVSTVLQDTARMSAGLAIAARPSVGWVRMVNPPCCLRCAGLAGKWFAHNTGFQRHPKCDCTHIPAVEDHPASIATSPKALASSGQIKNLTKPEAQALADGADVESVMNARRNLWMDSPMHPSLKRIYDNAPDQAAAIFALRSAGYLF